MVIKKIVKYLILPFLVLGCKKSNMSKDCRLQFYFNPINFNEKEISLYKTYYASVLEKLKNPTELYVMQIKETDTTVVFNFNYLVFLQAYSDTCNRYGSIIHGDEVIVEVPKVK